MIIPKEKEKIINLIDIITIDDKKNLKIKIKESYSELAKKMHILIKDQKFIGPLIIEETKILTPTPKNKTNNNQH